MQKLAGAEGDNWSESCDYRCYRAKNSQWQFRTMQSLTHAYSTAIHRGDVILPGPRPHFSLLSFPPFLLYSVSCICASMLYTCADFHTPPSQKANPPPPSLFSTHKSSSFSSHPAPFALPFPNTFGFLSQVVSHFECLGKCIGYKRGIVVLNRFVCVRKPKESFPCQQRGQRSCFL